MNCLLLFIIFVRVIASPVSAIDDPYLNCSAPFRCGNRDNISYPFWGGNRPEYCGYPDFKLNCESDVLEITIKDNTYRVLDINDTTRAVTVAREDYFDNLCPSNFVNTTLNFSLFNYAPGTENFTLYYSCPVNFMNGMIFGTLNPFQFRCNSDDDTTTNYFYSWDVNVFNASFSQVAEAYFSNCANRVVIPAFNTTLESFVSNPGSVSATRAIQEGFALQWLADNDLCDKCEGSGGECGYAARTRQFNCYCSDKPYPDFCQSGKGNNKISTGAVIGIAGGSAVAVILGLIFFCIIRRRRKSAAYIKSGNRLKKASAVGSGEVDYKTKSGTAWSHSYLNQKPWHPLSYPNQRRKWIAEQVHSQRQRRTEEVVREYAQEQEFFRQTSLISKKDKEKMETMQAVSFMYVRPPGYNAESAKAAELEEERKKQGDPSQELATAPMQSESKPLGEEKKKPRPKDVFGRPLPTEEEFEILKNAPRLETGAPARVKPFGVEVRNVKCLRCGNYGHQSGDRECPLKDAIMPNEESRLKRDDPLTAIMAHVDPSEPLKWELKRQPGNFSPPRGGFNPDDPNQQIVAEDIFDEYGGFLAGESVPDLLTSLSSKPRKKKSKKKSKHKRQLSPSSRELGVSDEDGLSSASVDGERRLKKERKHKKKKKRNHFKSSSSDDSEWDTHLRKNRHRHYYSSDDSDSDGHHKKRNKQKHSYSSDDGADNRHGVGEKNRKKHSLASEDSGSGRHRRREKSRQKRRYTSADDSDKHHRSEKSRHKYSHSRSYEGSESEGHHRSKPRRHH